MTTLAVMKARIADELGDRSDLTDRIARAIADAIAEYQQKRFWFNESRDVTFPTVAGQEFYTAADHADIPNLYRIDQATMLIGNQVAVLARRSEAELQVLSDNATQSGDPTDFAYFARQLRLCPVPNAVRLIRITGHVRFAAPTSDEETGNVWMTDAEKLVRSRAKYELAIHNLNDDELATKMAAAVTEQLTALAARTGRQIGRGRITPTVW
jgi:hypothetical protein